MVKSYIKYWCLNKIAPGALECFKGIAVLTVVIFAIVLFILMFLILPGIVTSHVMDTSSFQHTRKHKIIICSNKTNWFDTKICESYVTWSYVIIYTGPIVVLIFLILCCYASINKCKKSYKKTEIEYNEIYHIVLTNEAYHIVYSI